MNNSSNQRSISREDALMIIKSRKVIQEKNLGTKIKLKVTTQPYYYEENDRYIVNLNAMTRWHNQEAIRLFREGEYQEAVDMQLTYNVRPGVDYLPAKGEPVIAVIERITTNNGVTGEFVTSIRPLEETDTERNNDFEELLAMEGNVVNQSDSVNSELEDDELQEDNVKATSTESEDAF